MNAFQQTAAVVALTIWVGPPLSRAQSVERTVGEEQFGGSLQLAALTGPRACKACRHGWSSDGI